MPVNRLAPRPNTVRKQLRQKEQKGVLTQFTEVMGLARVIYLITRIFRARNQQQRARRYLMFTVALTTIGMMHIVNLDRHLTRMHASDFPEIKCMTDFSDEAFKTHFRFRMHDFHLIMHLMGYTDADGSPTWVEFGRYGHKYTVRFDWAFMCVLKRLTTVGRIEGVCDVMGGSRTFVSDTIAFMMELIHHKYARRIFNIRNGAPHFAR